MAAHALLGASGASRWLNCPGSARACEKIEEQSSPYAAEGTKAHEVAEKLLRGEKVGKVDPEMLEYCRGYAAYIDGLGMAMQSPELQVEARVDYSFCVPEGFGTADTILVADGVMHVIDLKYGQGVQVFADDNPQLKLYALGAWYANDFLYDIKEIHIHIYQPRLDHISVDKLDPSELVKWAEDFVKPRAKKAWDGVAEFIPGDTQCRFCKIKATCKALANYALATAAEGFDTVEDGGLDKLKGPKKLDRLTEDEVGKILPHLKLVEAWSKALQNYAEEVLLKGGSITGWKLVKGRTGNRSWVDGEAALEVLKSKGFKEKDCTKTALLTPTQCEKLVGKANFKELEELTSRADGKPKLAPEGDKRPSYLADASDGFEAVG